MDALNQTTLTLTIGLMYLIEFFVDKTPGVDTGWGSIHTFIRIPAEAVLAAGAVGYLNPAVELATAIMGGGLSACSHATKASAPSSRSLPTSL